MGSLFLVFLWMVPTIRKFLLIPRWKEPSFSHLLMSRGPTKASLANLPWLLCLLLSHPNDDKESGFFPRNASSSSVNSVLGNHHPAPSHGPDGAMPTMADDLGEPAPLWPHDPEAKEVSRLALTWARGQRGLPVSVEATDDFLGWIRKDGCLAPYWAWGDLWQTGTPALEK